MQVCKQKQIECVCVQRSVEQAQRVQDMLEEVMALEGERERKRKNGDSHGIARSGKREG